METTMITTANAQRWQAALDRAISNALDVLVSTRGEAYVESASVPGLIYSVSRESCSCPAGAKNQICQHRACYLAQVGELELEPQPERITFFGNSDRQEVRIDGRVFGDAVATEYGGWELFRGRFPYAKRIGTFCSLDEISRELEERLPAMLPAQPAVRIVELDAAAA